MSLSLSPIAAIAVMGSNIRIIAIDKRREHFTILAYGTTSIFVLFRTTTEKVYKPSYNQYVGYLTKLDKYF